MTRYLLAAFLGGTAATFLLLVAIARRGAPGAQTPAMPTLGSVRIASPVVVYRGTEGSFSADDQGVYFTEYLGRGEYGATQLVARPVHLQVNDDWATDPYLTTLTGGGTQR